MTDCLFCKIIAREVPATMVYEDDAVIAFSDIAPVRPGHTLVVPKEHATRLEENTSEAAAALITAVQRIIPQVLASVQATGWNMQVNSGAEAGQVIMHTHIHLIPRLAGDGLTSLSV